MLLNNVIFDFDGTLVDSLQDVLDCLKLAFEKCGVTVKSYDTGKIMHLQLRETIGTIAPGITVKQTDQVITRFKNIYDSIDYPNTRLMPTVAELLPKLYERSVAMFIVSNKRQVPTIRILEKLNIRHFFKGIFNPDMYEGEKWMTKSELLAHALRKYSLPKDLTAYIGDSEVDVTAAKENGIRAIAVKNGYGDVAAFTIKPDSLFQQINEILNV